NVPILLHGLCRSSKSEGPLACLGSNASLYDEDENAADAIHRINSKLATTIHNSTSHTTAFSMDSNATTLIGSVVASSHNDKSTTPKAAMTTYLDYSKFPRSLDVEVLFPAKDDVACATRLTTRLKLLSDALCSMEQLRAVRVTLSWVPRSQQVSPVTSPVPSAAGSFRRRRSFTQFMGPLDIHGVLSNSTSGLAGENMESSSFSSSSLSPSGYTSGSTAPIDIIPTARDMRRLRNHYNHHDLAAAPSRGMNATTSSISTLQQEFETSFGGIMNRPLMGKGGDLRIQTGPAALHVKVQLQGSRSNGSFDQDQSIGKSSVHFNDNHHHQYPRDQPKVEIIMDPWCALRLQVADLLDTVTTHPSLTHCDMEVNFTGPAPVRSPRRLSSSFDVPRSPPRSWRGFPPAFNPLFGNLSGSVSGNSGGVGLGLSGLMNAGGNGKNGGDVPLSSWLHQKLEEAGLAASAAAAASSSTSTMGESSSSCWWKKGGFGSYGGGNEMNGFNGNVGSGRMMGMGMASTSPVTMVGLGIHTPISGLEASAAAAVVGVNANGGYRNGDGENDDGGNNNNSNVRSGDDLWRRWEEIPATWEEFLGNELNMMEKRSLACRSLLLLGSFVAVGSARTIGSANREEENGRGMAISPIIIGGE
ncbi:hypothetical protein HDU76_002163, partial [Blyttiomyces sp. JEL0837]